MEKNLLKKQKTLLLFSLISKRTKLVLLLLLGIFAFQGHTSYLSAKTEMVSDNKKEITGTIYDDEGEPVIGASVIVKGTTTGSITDIDGRFKVQAKEGDVLVVSYLGYNTKEITIGDNSIISITITADAKELETVVVTALGIKRAEKALSYTVQEIKQDELTTVKSANFVNSLNGKIAGVTMNKSASGPGGATRVVMRGSKSLEGDNNVLYVIDGMPMFNTNMGETDSGIVGQGRVSSEGIADFNPEDIESISVLSGPSAAALYGSSAANGVILITTKKGEEGKLQINFSSSSEFSKAMMTPKFQNTYGNKDGAFESWGDKLATPSSYDPKKDFFNTGSTHINSLTLSTGTKQNQTFASIASTIAKGVVPNNKYDRLNFTIRNSTLMFQDKLKLDLGASFIRQKDMNMVSQGLYWNPIVAAYLFPRGESFQAIKTFETYNATERMNMQNWDLKDDTYAPQNPYWTAFRNLAPSVKERYMFNAGLSYQIFDWLSASTRVRFDRSFVSQERKLYASSHGKFAESNGNYESTEYKDAQEYVDAMLSFDKRFNDFSVSAVAGYSYSNFWWEERGFGGNLKSTGAPNKFAWLNIDQNNAKVIEKGGDSHVRNVGIFGSGEVGWRSMLYLTLTGRNDWSSRLVNTNNESFFYSSYGLSGIVNEMVTLPKEISFLKVRGSYSEVGAPLSRGGQTRGTTTNPTGGIGGMRKVYPFENYKAERTNSYEFGVNLRVIKKFNLDVTWYKSNTKNQTFVAPLFGNYEHALIQAGDIQNTGWEVGFGYDDNIHGVDISSTLTFSKNNNKIKKMAKDIYLAGLNTTVDVNEVIKEEGRVILKEGGSINDIYADQFLRKDNQGYIDIKEDGSFGLERVDPVYLGKTSPDFNLGWSNSFHYKGVGLSFLINGRFGGVVTSSTEAILDQFGVSRASARARDAGGVNIPNQGMLDAQKYYQMIGTGDYHTSGYYVYSATNIRLQELAVSYTLPNVWFNNVVKDLTVSFIANNPWMIYCRAPFDPELTPSTGTYGQGNDYFMAPSLRSFGFGVKAKF